MNQKVRNYHKTLVAVLVSVRYVVFAALAIIGLRLYNVLGLLAQSRLDRKTVLNVVK